MKLSKEALAKEAAFWGHEDRLPREE